MFWWPEPRLESLEEVREMISMYEVGVDEDDGRCKVENNPPFPLPLVH